METRGNTHTLIIRHLQNSDFGNYSCLVENSLGRTKKYIELTGKPGPVTFLGAPFSKWPNSYNVSWRVDSLPPLQEIRLLYRKLQVRIFLICHSIFFIVFREKSSLMHFSLHFEIFLPLTWQICILPFDSRFACCLLRKVRLPYKIGARD